MPEILLGAGASREKKLGSHGREEWAELITVDFNAEHAPDVVHDINEPLPFDHDFADEIHAYDVMEHIGQQGDWKTFFNQWSDIWRVLKPGGLFFGISPHWSSPWAWMDPGHSRVYGPEVLTFLCQQEYVDHVGKTPMTDYRFFYRADFDVLATAIQPNRQFSYVLRAVKPSRIQRGN